MVKLRDRYYDWLFIRCVTSTAAGEAIDSVIFITVGFLGTYSIEQVVTMICCQVVFKVLYEIICYPLTKKVISIARDIDDGELAGQI